MSIDRSDELLLSELERKDDFVVAAASVRTELCQSCGTEVVKYKCPCCESKNCSLACVNRHKVEKNCDGKRPVVTKIAMNEFTDAAFSRDIRYLDNMAQIVERSARLTSRQFSNRIALQSSGICKRKHLAAPMFRRKCEERQIRLRLCPAELAMRRSNTTQLTRKTKKLCWRIQWKFPGSGKTYVDTSISEESKLKDLLKRFVKPGALESEFNSTQECNVLFRDHSTNLESRWFLLDHEVKIVENLRHKTVIEVSSYLPADDLMTRFPTFVVVPSEALNVSPYDLILLHSSSSQDSEGDLIRDAKVDDQLNSPQHAIVL